MDVEKQANGKMKWTMGLLLRGALLSLLLRVRVVAGDDAPKAMNEYTQACFVREKLLRMLEDNAMKMKRFSGISRCMMVKLSKIEAMQVQDNKEKGAEDGDGDEQLHCYNADAMHNAFSDCARYLSKKNGDW